MARFKGVPKYQQTWVHYGVALAFVSIAVVGALEMRIRPPSPDFNEKMQEAIATQSCEGRPILDRFTGIGPVDLFLRMLVIAFLPGTTAAAGFDKGFQVLLAYFLISFFPVISIWCVESGRKGNRWSLISFPAIWSLFYQTVGGAIIIPLFYLAYMRTAARRQDYFSPDSRTVSAAYAKALIPSLLVGYLLPTVLLFLPYWDDATLQRLIALWQPSPLLVAILSLVLTPLFSDTTSTSTSISTRGDVKYLKIIYVLCFIVTSILHVGTMLYCLTSADPRISLATVFDLRLVAPGSSLVAGLKYIFQVDFWAIFVASIIWAYLAFYDVTHTHGNASGIVTAFILLAVASLIVGPGAVLSATWHWRENFLAKTKTT